MTIRARGPDRGVDRTEIEIGARAQQIDLARTDADEYAEVGILDGRQPKGAASPVLSPRVRRHTGVAAVMGIATSISFVTNDAFRPDVVPGVCFSAVATVDDSLAISC